MAERCIFLSSFTVERLYRNLLQLPRKYLEDEKLAVVIPTFAMVKESDEGSVSDCVNLYCFLVNPLQLPISLPSEHPHSQQSDPREPNHSPEDTGPFSDILCAVLRDS